MSSSPQNISAMSDISANIFSLLILILIIFLAARAKPNFPHADSPLEINIEKELANVERSPLSSDELFDLLYERCQQAASIKVDLFGETIDIMSHGKTEHFSSIENAASRLTLLASASNRAAIGIYVFNNRYYRGITEKLKALGRPWREVSVPQALMDSDATKRDQHWSAGFAELVAEPADRVRFRSELARLLQSSASHDRSDQGRGAPNSSWQSRDTIVKTFLRWLRTVVRVVSLLAGFTFVMWVETRRKRMRRVLTHDLPS